VPKIKKKFYSFEKKLAIKIFPEIIARAFAMATLRFP